MVRSFNVQPVILCGGTGSRLWPLSRNSFPKQFITLNNKKSLFQQTLYRLRNIASYDTNFSNPIAVTAEEHRFLLLEQAKDARVKLGELILEPTPRDTAPATTLAALSATNSDDDQILLIMPSDHVIQNEAEFANALELGINEAKIGAIVMLGIKPDRPETGFGYIEAKRRNNEAALEVQRFTEKPDIEKARVYIECQDYFWNSGIFIIRASLWLRALNEFRPDIMTSSEKAWNNRKIESKLEMIFHRPCKIEFDKISPESIDCAVIENAKNANYCIKMIPLNAGWCDLGSWEAVWENALKDNQKNATFGDVVVKSSNNSLVYSNSRLVTTLGVKNLIIIETSDAILVANKNSSQETKNLFEKLKKEEREEHHSHRKVYRPWGWYDTIDAGPNFKVKRIKVNPNSSLSLQKHQHRAEHWVVVTGVAEVTKGDDVFILTKNQSTYIEMGEIHRLKNPGKEILEIIEVQSGSYLGEDDIIRLEDDYNRMT